jgi:hypothetical protein
MGVSEMRMPVEDARAALKAVGISVTVRRQGAWHRKPRMEIYWPCRHLLAVINIKNATVPASFVNLWRGAVSKVRAS